MATKADVIPELVRNDVNGYLVNIDDYKAAVMIYERWSLPLDLLTTDMI